MRNGSSNDKRLERLEHLLEASNDPMRGPIDPDYLAIEQEFNSLAPGPYWKGGTKVEPKDEVREFYGRDDYSSNEHWRLAVRRALEKRYSGEELGARVAMWVAFADECDEAERGGR
jgi:hypothetical protein